MATIDSRLLDCESQPELTENFNRLLALVDALETRVESLEGQIAALEVPEES